MDKIILILATQNKGKINEIEALLTGQPIKVMNLTDFGSTPEPREDADTFEDNAYIKASL